MRIELCCLQIQALDVSLCGLQDSSANALAEVIADLTQLVEVAAAGNHFTASSADKLAEGQCAVLMTQKTLATLAQKTLATLFADAAFCSFRSGCKLPTKQELAQAEPCWESFQGSRMPCADRGGQDPLCQHPGGGRQQLPCQQRAGSRPEGLLTGK